MKTLFIVLSVICVVWAILFIRYAGNKYMTRMLGEGAPEKYDLKRFKIVYSGCLLSFAVLCIAVAISGNTVIASYVIALPVIIMWVLFFTWCRKRKV